MTLDQFFIMRHEILLIAAVLIILVADLFVDEEDRSRVNNIAITTFLVITLVGFYPYVGGKLFGSMYVVDEMRLLMKNILNLSVLVIFFQSSDWLLKIENRNKLSEFYILTLSALIGMQYMISSGHFLMFYLGLELATIPIAALAAYERFNSKSAEAGIKLILSSAFSSGVLLFGLSLIYAETGTFYFEAMNISAGTLTVLGFVFFFSGLGFKISIVPFHLWTADVYEGAPVNVTSFLSVVSKGAALFILVIVLYQIFAPIVDLWANVIYVTAIATMTVGNLFAIRQNNMKRFLAFSSIAQAGFILLGVIGASQLGMATVVYFVFIYLFSNLGAFGVVSIISSRTGKENITDYNGLYRTNPRLSLILLLSLFSLAGIPPVAGFFGKFFLFTAAAEQGYIWLVVIAVLNTVIALYYYLLVVKAMFINKNDNPIETIYSPLTTKFGLVICVGGIILVGFYSDIYEYIYQLSSGLLP